MKRSEYDVLIVGAGPSGLALALRLHKQGIKKIRVLERESVAGGIPRHSFHTGYGLRDLHRLMSGPKYSQYYVSRIHDAGIDLSTNTTAFDWAGEHSLALTSSQGLEEVTAQKIILATGARERPRTARLVPGARPRGIFTTGSLQQSVYLNSQTIGSRAVIVGTDHVSYSALITLSHADVKTVAMIESGPKIKSFPPISIATKLLYGYKLFTRSDVIDIKGTDKVEAVVIRHNGIEKSIPCDTVVFTADWIPDNELARKGNLIMDQVTKSPIVNAHYETSRSGVFAVGNLLLPIKAADQCVLDSNRLKF